MTGYVRKDTTNNIADGNVINAADLDAEFDGVQDAFNASTGHKHDGTAGEGATINALGPTQDVTVSASLVAPKTTNTVDIGSNSLKFKDLFLAGNASVGGTLAVTGVATLTAQPILSSLTASRAVFTDGSKGLVSNAITGTGNVVMSASPTLTGTIGGENATLSGTLGVTGVATFTAQPILSSLTASRAVFSDGSKGLVSNAITGTGNVVMSASPTLTGTIDAAALTASGNVTLSGGTANGVAYLNGSKVVTSGSALTFDGTKLDVVQTGASSGGALIRAYNTTDGVGAGQIQIAKFGSSASYGPYSANTVGVNASGTNLLFGTESNHPVIFYQNNSEQMRLTSTGLGIGTSSPASALYVKRTSGNSGIYTDYNGTNVGRIEAASNGNLYIGITTGSGDLSIGNTASATALNLSASGNLGLGVTPSAYSSGWRGLQILGTGANIKSNGSITIDVASNTTGDFKYAETNLASTYRQTIGQHQWYTAASGTAGNAISFSTVMTLDASGRLGVGTTSPSNLLHVKLTSGGDTSQFEGAGASDSRINITNTGVSNTYLGFNNSGSTNGVGIPTGVAYFANGNSYPIAFSTNNIERARITSGGDLIIGGTSNDGRRLTVNGNTNDLAGIGITYIGVAASSIAVNSGGNLTFNLNSSDGKTERARFSSAGDFIVGGTGGYGKITSANGTFALVTDTASQRRLSFWSTANGDSENAYIQVQNDGATTNTGEMLFATKNQGGTLAERARIDASGNFQVGFTGSQTSKVNFVQSANLPVLTINNTNASFTDGALIIYNTRATTNSSYNHFACYNGDFTGQFIVRDSGNAVNTNNSYGAVSDVKLKENIVDASPKLDKLNQVRVVNYNLIGSEQKQLGVIAQELEQVFPSMVEEATDRDAEGNDLGTTTKSVKYSVFVPMLIKAIQEQQAIIESLKARLDAANL